MEYNTEEYYNVLIDFFRDSEAVEYFLKACEAAAAINARQLSALAACAEECAGYLECVGSPHVDIEYIDHFWYKQYTAMHHDEWEALIAAILRSGALLAEYVEAADDNADANGDC